MNANKTRFIVRIVPSVLWALVVAAWFQPCLAFQDKDADRAKAGDAKAETKDADKPEFANPLESAIAARARSS